MSKDNLNFENKVQEIRNGIEYLQNAHDDEIIRLYKVIGDLQAELEYCKQLGIEV